MDNCLEIILIHWFVLSYISSTNKSTWYAHLYALVPWGTKFKGWVTGWVDVCAPNGSGMDKIASLRFWRLNFKLSSYTSGSMGNSSGHRWILRRKRHGLHCLHVLHCKGRSKQFQLQTGSPSPAPWGSNSEAAVVMTHTGQEDLPPRLQQPSLTCVDKANHSSSCKNLFTIFCHAY